MSDKEDLIHCLQDEVLFLQETKLLITDNYFFCVKGDLCI